MTRSNPAGAASLALRAGVIAVLAGAGLLAPIRMADGSPRTRFDRLAVEVVPAPAPAGYTAASVGPVVPPPPSAVVTAPFPVSHLGVAWFGDDEAPIDLRLVGPDGRWSPWMVVRADHDLDDGPHDLRHLSHLVLVDGATRFQVRATGDVYGVELIFIDSVSGARQRVLAGAAPAAAAEPPPRDPADAEYAENAEDSAEDAQEAESAGNAEDPEATAADAEDEGAGTEAEGDGAERRSAGQSPGSNGGNGTSQTTTTTTRPGENGAVAQPEVITRAQWGADESLRKGSPKFAPIVKLFVHHTVTGRGADDPNPAATVRAIYAYHTQGNGWDDIGYHFLVDAQGRIYEGRWARDYDSDEVPTGEDVGGNGVVGAHVAGHNFGSAAVAVLGDYTAVRPTSPAMEGVRQLLAWKADRHNIDVEASSPFTATDGTTRTFPNLAGHRDAGRTACPGDRLYPLLPDLRREVAKVVTVANTPGDKGYWTATADGRVLPFGEAQALGSMADHALNAPVVAMAATRSGAGYWLMGADGGIFSFGDARFFGSTGDLPLNLPVVRLEPTPTGKGYWLVASDGGIFSFGDAGFYGSTGDRKLNQPIVGMASTPTGEGYWLVASDGGIFAFGDAEFFGSTGDIKLNSPIVSMARNRDGTGYWLVAADGGVFAFDVPFYGSIPALGTPDYPGAVQVRVTSTGKGYYIADHDGGIFIFGDARFFGSDPRQKAPKDAVDLAVRP